MAEVTADGERMLGALGRMSHGALAKVWNSWSEYAERRAALMLGMRRAAARIIDRHTGRAWGQWMWWVDEAMRLRGVASRMSGRGLSEAWNRWAEGVEQVRRAREVTNP